MPYNSSFLPGGGGLLTQGGGGFGGFSPLTQFGLGLLSQSGPSLTPQSPWSAIGKAGAYASEAQQQAMQNELIRAKLGESARAAQSQAVLQEYISKAKEPLVAGIPNEILSAGLANDPTAFSKLIPQALTAEDRLQLMKLGVDIEKIKQDVTSTGAETTTPAGAAVRSIETLADTFDAVEKGDNPFAPGRMFYKDAPLGQLGVSPDAALGLPDIVLKQWGDPETIRKQAQQAQLIDKETASISRSLQSLAQQAGGGRSATAIEQMQTSLGEGNIGIPVRRKVIASTLETVIDDMETKGLTVPDQWYKLRDRLNEQTKGVGLEVPDKETGGGFNPMNLVPENMRPNTSTVTSPQPGVPMRVSPPTPATTTPPVKGVKTSQFGINPMTGQSVPKYNRAADAERALPDLKKQGVTHVIVIDPKTGVEYLYGVD